MHRLIQQKIREPLAEEILFGKLEHGGTVNVSAEKDEIKCECTAAEKDKVKGSEKEKEKDTAVPSIEIKKPQDEKAETLKVFEQLQPNEGAAPGGTKAEEDSKED